MWLGLRSMAIHTGGKDWHVLTHLTHVYIYNMQHCIPMVKLYEQAVPWDIDCTQTLAIMDESIKSYIALLSAGQVWFSTWAKEYQHS